MANRSNSERLRGFCDRRTDRRTFAILESLSQLKMCFSIISQYSRLLIYNIIYNLYLPSSHVKLFIVFFVLCMFFLYYACFFSHESDSTITNVCLSVCHRNPSAFQNPAYLLLSLSLDLSDLWDLSHLVVFKVIHEKITGDQKKYAYNSRLLIAYRQSILNCCYF